MVHLGRRAIPERLVDAAMAIEVEIRRQRLLRLPAIGIVPQVHLLVFDASPQPLIDFVSSGITAAEGGYFLKAAYEKRGNSTPEHFDDLTGYECHVNHVHLDDHVASTHYLCVSLALVDVILRQWNGSAFSSIPIEIICSTDGDTCTVTFHVMRDNEVYLNPDLESFRNEAILVCRSSTGGK